jgi:hypothetical protein
MKNFVNNINKNGKSEVGISGSNDKGLPVSQYTRIPRCMFKEVIIKDSAKKRKSIKSLDLFDRKEYADKEDAMRYYLHNGDWVFEIGGTEYAKYKHPGYEDDDLKRLIQANHTLYDASWTDDATLTKDLWVTTKILSVLHGAVDYGSKSEHTIVDDPDISNFDATPELVEIFNKFAENYNRGMTFIAASVINWYTTNHNTGGQRAIGAAYKVLKIHGADMNARNEQNTTWFYNAVHAFNKRIGHCMFYDKSPSMTFTTIPGLMHIYKVDKDTFLSLRTKRDALPAGTRKLGICVQAIRKMALTGLLAFGPSDRLLNALSVQMSLIAADPIIGHEGKNWYLRDSNVLPSDVNQNDEEIIQLFDYCVVFLTNIYPNSSLSRSPSVLARAPDAAGELVDWDAQTKQYERAFKAKDSSVGVTALVMGKTEKYGKLDRLVEEFKNEPNEVRKKVKAEEVSFVAIDTSRRSYNELVDNLGGIWAAKKV